VLHALQKKSTKGAKINLTDVRLISQELKAAKEDYERRYAKRKLSASVVPSSGNVFADLHLPNAEEKQTKVRLAVAINQIIEGMGLSQPAAATRLHLNPPKISALANYRLSGFSVGTLIRFLNALGHDVEIVIHKPRSGRSGKIQVTTA
jgi:predicted XRE-type DNA-binding protein